MKMIVKVLLTAAAIAALAAPALAADKLIVRNAGDTADVFKVADDGTITTAGFVYNGTSTNTGFGTTSPVAALSVTAQATSATRGVVISQHTSNAASAVAGFRKSRGTEAVPVTVNTGDYIGAFGFKVYDGTSWVQTGSFGARVNGTVATGSVPTEIYFCNNATNLSDCYGSGSVRMLIGATGNVGIGTLTPTSKLHVVGLPTYASNAAAITGGLTAGAFYTDGAGNVKIVY